MHIYIYILSSALLWPKVLKSPFRSEAQLIADAMKEAVQVTNGTWLVPNDHPLKHFASHSLGQKQAQEKEQKKGEEKLLMPPPPPRKVYCTSNDLASLPIISHRLISLAPLLCCDICSITGKKSGERHKHS
jgi:hypothetical protein